MATRSIAPLTVTLWRFVISALVLGAIALYRREAWPTRLPDLAFAAVTGVVAFTVQFTALYRGLATACPPPPTALIACSAPLVVAVVGAALGWDRLTGRQWLGVLLGVLGVVVTSSDRWAGHPARRLWCGP